MQRIQELLQKLGQLFSQKSMHIIDADLMIDCTKELYKELLDLRGTLKEEDKIGSYETDVNVIDAEKEIINAKEGIALDEKHVPIELLLEVTPVSSIDTKVATRATDIRSLISINDKYQFISELFHNDKAAYEDTLAEVSAFETEEQALEWLNFSISDAYDWQEESDALQMFYKLLSDFFTRR